MEILCKECGYTIPSTRVFCDADCRHKWHNRRNRRIAKAKASMGIFSYHIKCNHIYCSNIIHTNSKNRKYCCSECRFEQVKINREIKKEDPMFFNKKTKKPEKLKPLFEFKKREIKDDYLCSGGCGKRTWKYKGYCLDCQKAGKVKSSISDRVYRSGLSVFE